MARCRGWSDRRRRVATLLIGSAVLPISAALALEPQRAITQYGHDIWTSQPGLGEAVYQIVRSRDDYLWLRTSKGLVRFDGVRFAEPLAGSACPNETVLAIGKTVDGQLFVRGATRTCVLRNAEFLPIPPTGRIPDGLVRIAHQARDGRLWIGADDFIYRSEGDRFAELRRGTGWIFALREDRAGAIWVGGNQALYRYSADGETIYRAGLEDSGAMALLEDHRGEILAGTLHGLYRLVGDRLIEEPAARSLHDQKITALLEDRDGNLWLGTDRSGVHRLTAGRLSSFMLTDGLLDNEVLSLAEDNEGSVWVGTRAGLDRFRDTPFTPLTTREGLAGDDLSTVVEGQDGSIFAFSEGRGLTRLRDGSLTAYGPAHGLPSVHGGTLHAGRDGGLWIGTLRGLSQFRDGRFTTYAQGPLGRGFISAIGEDDESLILATAEPSLWRFKDGTTSPLTVHGRPAPLPTSGNYVFSIHHDAGGSLWLGSVRGLYRLRAGEVGDSRQASIDFPVTAIYDDGAGSLWLAGRTPGITRFHVQDGQVARFAAKEGLVDEEIASLTGDAQGRL